MENVISPIPPDAFSCSGTHAFGMGSSNSLFATKACACAFVTFLVGIVSWCVGKYDFFLLLSCSLFVLYPYLFLRLDSPAFCLLSLLHNTDIHAPGGIRTCSASKRSLADPGLRPLGSRDRQLEVTSTWTDIDC
jgi:hypothetical protein